MSKLRREVLLLCATLCALGAGPRESRAAKVDFLWVIDNSPSMAGEQAVLSAAADDIGNQLATARVAIDWFAAGMGCEPVPGGDCTLRPDAQLAVIFMTDTGEQTTDAEAPPAEPDNSVLSWINYFSDYDVLRPAAQRALVNGILCPLRPTVDDPVPCSDRLPDPALFDRYSQ